MVPCGRKADNGTGRCGDEFPGQPVRRRRPQARVWLAGPPAARSRLLRERDPSPVRFTDDGRVEVAVADPADADQEVLERVLGRSVELVVGERSAIQDAWRYTPSCAS